MILENVTNESNFAHTYLSLESLSWISLVAEVHLWSGSDFENSTIVTQQNYVNYRTTEKLCLERDFVFITHFEQDRFISLVVIYD